MVSWIISRVIVLVFGTLFPAYYSFKAVKSKNVKEYVRWMMYWIVFALYTVVETITDLSLAWFPVYYELKMAFVFWLLSPYTRGASVLYRKFLHPMLASKEREIDEYIVQAREKSYVTMVNFGRQGLTIAAAAAVTAAVKVLLGEKFQVILYLEIFHYGYGDCAFQILASKSAGNILIAGPVGQGAISERLRSFSIPDLTQIPSEQSGISNPSRRALLPSDSEPYKHAGEGHEEETDGIFSEDEASVQKGLRRSQSVKLTRAKAARKEPRYGSLKLKPRRRQLVASSTFDHP